MNEREPPSGWIENGAHIFPLRVYYEDTDFSGVVYHATYLRFLERGRSEFLRALGILHRELAAGGAPVNWAVRRIAVDYVKPASVEEALTVHTRSRNVSGARCRVAQEIRRGDDVLVTADVEVCLVSGGKPQRIPADIRTRLENLSM